VSETVQTPVIASIPISHPDRLVYPDVGIRKVDLARFYESIADWIVPHVRGRPLTLVHCPNGMLGLIRFGGRVG